MRRVSGRCIRSRETRSGPRAIADVSAKDQSAKVRYMSVSTMKMPTFGFQVAALVAALEDRNPQVRLAAGTNLAMIGMRDERTVPALCRAALKADYATREGVGTHIDLLIMDRASDKLLPEETARRCQAAVREFQTVLETPEAAARKQVMNALGRLIVSYQTSRKPALLAPASRRAGRARAARG